MKKQQSLIYIAVTTLFLISACSTLKKINAGNDQQSEQAVTPEVELCSSACEQMITPPQEISIASVNELQLLFDRLKYNRESWTKGNCKVPRITFSGVTKNWKESADKLPVKIKKELFFRLMTPLILIANEQIKVEREIIENSALNSKTLQTLALKYRLIDNTQSKLDENLRERLLQRVDLVPPSLALAQAAEESGWATSRFAQEGNAFFGQWDFSGNGMKPLAQRKELGNYGVARFATPLASVEGYMFNINTNKAYQKLRRLRAQLRAAKKTPSGYDLAVTLGRYSERGLAYIEGLQTIIRYNKLAQMDQAYLADNQLIHITTN